MRRTSRRNRLSTFVLIVSVFALMIAPGSLVLAQEETPPVEAPIVVEQVDIEAPPSELPTVEPVTEELPTEVPTEVVPPVELPTEVPPTEAPPVVELPTVAAPVVPTVPAAAVLPPEPMLLPIFIDNFETDLGTWTLGAGWSRTPSEGGQALQVVNSAEPVTFVRSDIYDGAVQARFLLNGGAAGLSVRQSAAGSYTAALDSSGSVRLYRNGALFGEAVVPFTAGQWYTLRLSAIADGVRVAVNGVEVLAVQDVSALPPGAVAINGGVSALVDDFVLWLPGQVNNPAVPTLPPLVPSVEVPLAGAMDAETFGRGPGHGNGPGNGPGNPHDTTFREFRGRVKVKVLTIAMFEIGELVGDFAGEAQHWIVGEGLYRVVNFPGGFSPAYCNQADHCLILTGVGFGNAAASVMAAGLSDRLDLSDAYILIAGIAGVDPEDGTLGSAAWADWVVDGDLAHHIDAREMPGHLQYPMFRLNCYTEGYCPDGRTWGVEVYQLNTQLVNWAMHLSQNVTLTDNAASQATRANYPAHLPASQPPSIIRCDSLGSSTYWHGTLLGDWANWWVSNWTGGAGNYCMTNQEDAATMTALRRLADAGLVDFNRVMVLRTSSNFDQPYVGQDVMTSLSSISGGFAPSTSNAYLVGSAVTDHIISNWHQWRHGVPSLP